MLRHYKGYFIDLDGTIYKGKERIPAAKGFIERLQAAHVPFLFLTNNTTKTPEAVVDNLAHNHGIHVSPETVYTPSLATAAYLTSRAQTVGHKFSFYCIGELGLKKALLDAGMTLEEVNPDYVVVGLDYDVTYHKFETATLAIKRGARFIGTNEDTNLPNERGLVPGAGSLVALVERATQQKAFYIGKPQVPIMRAALNEIGLPPKDVIMVGDNYHTDIQAGINTGMDTLLVTTGYTKPTEVPKLPVKPTYVVASLADWQVEA
ncbi:TIGR01457 family HAD-type hydrolase [Schleiferilactobacillus perolens]|uniref:TIGR01457 family HAD-type hydrolase n=1 Tax=Schleiferilactobacillus perolens TaxID=100468 RepID=UPI000709A91C|nr:TIGR01457 family HAD-type hydrolase [Schleiferilactobacillus perolens]MCI1891261.1 TIGR01457 family HAD-type hydrolase [Schleiferilactobacillus harbinensis]MCI1912699.1 TIGR01457 family HAD-type hydrolase [Schleiferilactobacillus harbinensis]MCI2172519.1 TIGR01457 family HAD-type hydrolase [Schleiferilactobacillus perolens]